MPSLNENITITQCDDDFDGLSSFNLFSAREDLANFTSLRNVNFSFFLSESDAINDVDAISSPQNFKNTEPNQQLFAKVRTLNGCTDITSFNVTASFIQIGNITDTFSCESTGPNAILNESLFDRDELIMKIRNELSLASDVSLRLFPGYEDSLNNLNEIFFNFSSPSTTIYIKIVEPDFSCGGIANMSLIVNPKPSINLDELYTICFNPNAKPPIIISAGENNDSFEWRNSQGNIIETEKDFELSSVGEFSLTAYKTENGILCSNTEFFTVINPLKANFERIEVNTKDEQNNIVSVVVLGNSTYEFSIDNINFFGNNTSYTFNNVEAGLRTIYVRDINNCEQPIETKVTVIGFKKFFTPNGDGENDFWNIKGIDAASFKSINVKIFDRYGKVIGTITNFDSPGWDGIYNGKNLIANNYWFKSVIIDKDDNIIENSGNFSLIRN